MITTTMKPEAPKNLNDVSTWTEAQRLWAAPRIVTLAAKFASETSQEAREMRCTYPEGANELGKIAERHLLAAVYWSAVAAGDSPKVPVFLREQRVSSYQQINARYRPSKSRYAGPKDYGVFSR